MAKPARNASPDEILRSTRIFFATTKTSMGRSLLQSERNALLLIDVLRSCVAERKFQLHDFVVMPDHLHLLVTVDGDMTIEKAMQLIKGRFSYRLKKEFGYLGEVWQRGFSEARSDDEESRLRYREYIAQNPVKAGMVDSPEQYPYCYTYLAKKKEMSPAVSRFETMSATVKVHGMDGTLVEPDWPPLTLAEVRSLLAHFPACGEPIEILSLSPRPFSAAGVASTSAGRVFIKRHHRTVRNREGLLEEHRFLQYLHAQAAPVPRVLENASGDTAIETGEWTYEVHEAPEAVDLYGEAVSWTPFRTSAHAHSAGKALARLHRASQGFAAPRRRPRPLVAGFTIFAGADPRAQADRYLAARPALAVNAAVHAHCLQALELLAPFHAALLPLLSALPPLWTHNDLHASNLLWSDSGPDARATTIIDFGLADRTNAVHDLAHAIERNIVEWLALVEDSAHPEDVPVHLDHLDALLDGYESVRPLSIEEAAALAPMTALCHAEFALSETDYFLGILHSKEQAQMAYDGWLVGHARWFHSSAGNKLLNALRRWATARRREPRRVEGHRNRSQENGS